MLLSMLVNYNFDVAVKIRFWGITFWQTKRKVSGSVEFDPREKGGFVYNLPAGLRLICQIEERKPEGYTLVIYITDPLGSSLWSKRVDLLVGDSTLLDVNASWRGGYVRGTVDIDV